MKRILRKDQSARELELIEKDWLFLAREEQFPPDEWGADGCFIWNVRAGRGYGKTRMSAEVFIHAVQYGGYTLPNLAGATAEDVRDIMIEGESGILACAPDRLLSRVISLHLNNLIWPNGVSFTHLLWNRTR